MRFIFILLLTGILSEAPFAQNNIHVHVQRDIAIEMPDDVILYHDMYLPDAEPPYPVILIRTPYQKEGAEVFGEFFAGRGYAVVVQDVRGKYSSEGIFIPFHNEYRDGIATLDWISDQDWCDGNIGMWGSSYIGFSGLILSNSGHTALKSIFSLSGWIDGTSISEPGGAFHQQMVIPWLLFEGQKTKQPIQNMDLEDLFHHVPTKNILPEMNFEENGETYSLEAVTKQFTNFNYSEITIPTMHMNGWFDFALESNLETFSKMAASSKAFHHMIIGPWYHNQLYDENPMLGDYRLPDNVLPRMGWMLNEAEKWFRKTLIEQYIPSSNSIRYYSLYENSWKETTTWPPWNVEPFVMYLSADSMKSSKLTENNLGQVSFVYDPAHPVPTTGGANFNFFLDQIGIRNQAAVEARDDVLLFTSESFTHDQHFAGNHSTTIFVETEGIGTDFTAKLTKVDSIGTSYNLLDAILRVPPETLTEQPARIRIDLGNVAFAIKKGERIRLQISSSNFPKFNRNPNTGIEPMEAEIFKKVEQRIRYSQEFPSRLTLSTIKR